MQNQVKELLDKQINEGQELLNKCSETKSAANFEELSNLKNKWVDFSKSLISKYFDADIQREFRKAEYSVPIIGTIDTIREQQLPHKRVEAYKKDLDRKLNKLESIRDRLPLLISNQISDLASGIRKELSEMGLQEKLEALLQKQIDIGNQLFAKAQKVSDMSEIKALMLERDRWFDKSKKLVNKIDETISENYYGEFSHVQAYQKYMIDEDNEFDVLSELLVDDIQVKTNALMTIQECLEISFLDSLDTKNTDLTQFNAKSDSSIYDIAFSFAGEQRNYVQKVAEYLKSSGIKVFYDKFAEVDLWGKSLIKEFSKVYGQNSKYCIPFISKEYKEKVWTNHEFKNAISKALEKKDEIYLLPVRFDETELEGLYKDTLWLDANDYLPEQLAKAIIQKISEV